MRTSLLAYSFTGSFLLTTVLLHSWQRAAYPAMVWMMLGCTIVLCTAIGLMCRLLPFARLGTITTLLTASLLGIALSLFVVSRSVVTLPAIFLPHRTPITASGRIADTPIRRRTGTQYILDATKLQFPGGVYPAHTANIRILVTDRYGQGELHFGEMVTLSGTVEEPFSRSYEQSLRAGSIALSMELKNIEERAAGPFSLLSPIYALREVITTRTQLLLPEPHASLLLGILVGSRTGLPPELRTEFVRTGLIHITAVSGSNITMVLTALNSVLFFLPLQWRTVPLAAGILVYVTIVGGSSSAVRAAIMGILGVLALRWGRQSHMRLALLWTATLMTAWNPRLLWYDLGFHLSFLATLGLTELARPLLAFFTRIPNTLGFKENLVTTVAAQIATTPWILYSFGTLSLIAPLANLVVAPFIPLAMLSGTVSLLTSFLWLPLGRLLGVPTWMALQGITASVHALALLPGAAFEEIRMSGILTAASYAVIIITVRLQRKHVR